MVTTPIPAPLPPLKAEPTQGILEPKVKALSRGLLLVDIYN